LRSCKGENKDGSPCRATPLSDQDFCFFHSPNRDRERKAAKSKAGKVTALRFQGLEHLPADGPDFELKGVEDCKVLLERIINLTVKGKLAHQISNCVGQLLGVYLRSHESGEIERRLKALEERISNE
jgi:hypothetical protein